MLQVIHTNSGEWTIYDTLHFHDLFYAWHLIAISQHFAPSYQRTSWLKVHNARVMELVDLGDSKSLASRRGGSNPPSGTIHEPANFSKFAGFFYFSLHLTLGSNEQSNQLVRTQ